MGEAGGEQQDCGLTVSSQGGGYHDSGVTVKIRNAGVQVEELLRWSLAFKAELAAFLLPGQSMGLLHQGVATGRQSALDVFHGIEHKQYTGGCPIASQFVGMDDPNTSYFLNRRTKKVLASSIFHCSCRKMPSTSPSSSTVRHKQCLTPSTSTHISSRCY